MRRRLLRAADYLCFSLGYASFVLMMTYMHRTGVEWPAFGFGVTGFMLIGATVAIDSQLRLPR